MLDSIFRFMRRAFWGKEIRQQLDEDLKKLRVCQRCGNSYTFAQHTENDEDASKLVDFLYRNHMPFRSVEQAFEKGHRKTIESNKDVYMPRLIDTDGKELK
jgi:hypothetical protein